MLIQPISYNQQNFKAVNQKYLNWAKEDIKLVKNVSTEWCDRLSIDVFLSKKISNQDAKDTIIAVKELLNKTDIGIEQLLKALKKPNP